MVVEARAYAGRVTAAPGGAFAVATRRITDPQAARTAASAAFGAPTAVWRRGEDSLTAHGAACVLEFAGADRFAAAAAAWRRIEAGATVDDEVRIAGSGPVAFGVFAFADGSAARSVLIVPRVVVGARGGVAFRTEIGGTGAGAVSCRPAADASAGFAAEEYVRAVRAAVDRIRDGGLQKVVLARDVAVDVPDLDVTAALGRLAERHRDAWVYAVDGFFGASPETLVTVHAGELGSRVLAGTAQRSADPDADAASRATLLDSPKNRFEHALAVDSLLLTLGELVDGLTIGRPFALGLPNVWHLATDAVARVREGVGALDLVGALHPTAAVAGAPRGAALAAIAQLEPFDRRRYAGPVGWVGAGGSGEWAIGLRSAEVEGPHRIRAYAGAGVVAASDAEQELAETGWKLAPVLEAVGGAVSAAGGPPAGSVPLAAR